MTEFRFIHGSDLHLGKGFANFPEEIGHRLREARHGAIRRLADAARARGAAHVLVAGDVFDSETPSDPVWRQALAAMAEDAALHWLLLPGNHDSLAAEALWDRVRRHAPANVTALGDAASLLLAERVRLLAGPPARRYSGEDPSEWMDGAPSAAGETRLGLTHGPVRNFGEGDRRDLVAPNRAERAGLDYLALGDWHGRLRIDARTWYSGAPERTDFRHSGRGECLAVTLPGPGAEPVVEPVAVGAFDWAEEELPLLPGEEAAAALAALLPAAGRRDWLLRVRASGRAGLGERAALLAAAAEAEPEFGWFALDADALRVEIEPGDLDEIDRAGALREAAEALRAEATDEAADGAAREIARAALARLHGILRKGGR